MKMIAAVCKNGGLGFKNKIPWKLPEDMAFFKEKTMGQNILMGNNTFISLKTPLKARTNWVLSRENRVSLYNNVKYIKNITELPYDVRDNITVIGGGQVYKSFIDKTEILYLTVIEEEFQCDTFFPLIHNFDIAYSSRLLTSKTGLKYKFLTLKRNNIFLL